MPPLASRWQTVMVIATGARHSSGFVTGANPTDAKALKY